MDLDCRGCDAILQKERGCISKGIIPFRIDNELLFRCPNKIVTSLSWGYLKTYSLFKKGLLPNGKSWLFESEKYLDAMALIESEVAKLEEEKMKQIKPKGLKKHGRR